MTSVVEICNLALSHIRARSINSLNEASIEAQQCKLKYPVLRDFLLRDVPWGFAHKTIALAQRAGEDPLEWVYAYQYPADALKILYVTADFGDKDQTADGLAFREYRQQLFIEPVRQVPFEISNIDDNRVILTDQEDAYAVYNSRVTDPNLFSAQFVMALSYYLASELVMPVVGGDIAATLRGQMLQLYTNALNAAVASNANEKHRAKRDDNEFINAHTL